MKIFGLQITKEKPTPAATSRTPETNYVPMGAIISEPWSTFDGEKTYGELGRPIKVKADYRALRLRAYEQELKADLVRAITGKFFKWVVGSGLKLQANPKKFILQSEGITLDYKKLKKQCEERFNLFAFSKNADFSKMRNLHELAFNAYMDSFLGGDCLVIFRVEENNYPSVQVIDGQEIREATPEQEKIALDKGNTIKHGIETNERGEHIAFYVTKHDGEIERIPAIVKVGDYSFKMARLIYGRKHRINDLRGISSLTSIIEKIDKLDRFSEASVAAAEERANIVYAIEHNQYSTGENPTAQKLLGTLRTQAGDGGVINNPDAFDMAEKTSRRIVETTSKQAFNMPIGSKLSVLDSDAEFNYDKFMTAVLDGICASLDIPPEIALEKFNSNYSASRAAINAWQHTINIARDKFAEEFYQPFYELFFYCQCLMGKLEGHLKYIDNVNNVDFLVPDAFTNARFVGVNMPHIDPLKEVKAMRELLGERFKDVALISLDQATEQLNQGDWEENNAKIETEIENIKIEENGSDK